MLGRQTEVSVKTTKERPDNAKAELDEDREHYEFDYSKAKPNRFAERLSKEAFLIVLDADVARVFKTSESVNDALRLIIKAPDNLAASQHSVEDVQRVVPVVAS